LQILQSCAAPQNIANKSSLVTQHDSAQREDSSRIYLTKHGKNSALKMHKNKGYSLTFITMLQTKNGFGNASKLCQDQRYAITKVKNLVAK